MSETTEHTSSWAIGDLEPEIVGLRAAIGILGHLIQSPVHVERSEWCRVEDELIDHGKRIEALWQQAWDQMKATDEKHRTEIAALKAEVEDADEPLSGARLERLESLQGMLRGMANVIVNTLDGKSVSILKGLIEGMAEREPEPEPPPAERMRW
jgi:hypothetical protein